MLVKVLPLVTDFLQQLHESIGFRPGWTREREYLALPCQIPSFPERTPLVFSTSRVSRRKGGRSGTTSIFYFLKSAPVSRNRCVVHLRTPGSTCCLGRSNSQEVDAEADQDACDNRGNYNTPIGYQGFHFYQRLSAVMHGFLLSSAKLGR